MVVIEARELGELLAEGDRVVKDKAYIACR